MVPKDKILELETRKIIYNTILKKPGLHLRGLDREIKISLSTIRYHLNYLESKGLINSVTDSGFTRFYANHNIGRKEKKLINLLRQNTIIKILVVFLLSESKKIFFKEDLIRLPNYETWWDPENFQVLRHRTTIEYHLKKLVELDILEVVYKGRKKGYTLVDSEKLWDFFIKHNERIDSGKITDLLNWANDFIIPHQIDKFMGSVWDIFPHPYWG